MVATLEAWAQQFGDNETYAKSNRVGFDYELNVAYMVAVKSAKIIKTRRDEISLQLDLEILSGDDVVGTTREWLTLPKQVTDKDMAAETVRKVTFRRRDDLQRILSRADTQSYAVFTERKQNDGRATYLLGDKEMTAGELKERERKINIEVMNLSDEWHDRVGQSVDDVLADTTFWIVKAPNKKNADYPYTNYYNVKPEKLPVFGDE